MTNQATTKGHSQPANHTREMPSLSRSTRRLERIDKGSIDSLINCRLMEGDHCVREGTLWLRNVFSFVTLPVKVVTVASEGSRRSALLCLGTYVSRVLSPFRDITLLVNGLCVPVRCYTCPTKPGLVSEYIVFSLLLSLLCTHSRYVLGLDETFEDDWLLM